MRGESTRCQKRSKAWGEREKHKGRIESRKLERGESIRREGSPIGVVATKANKKSIKD